MEDYDPKVIREAFPDDSHEGLHRIKSVLLNEVVKYIYESHPFNGKRDLWQMIGEAKHLRDVAADSIALNRINAAIKLALGMEAMAELLDAIRLRRKMIEGQENEIDFSEIEDYALAGVEETLRIDRLYSELFRLRSLPAVELNEAVANLEVRLKGTPPPVLIKNQLQILNVKHYIARRQGKIQTCISSSQLIIELAESHPKVLADSDLRDVYFHSVTFLAVAFADKKNFDLSERYLEQIKSLAKIWGGGLEGNPNLNARYIYSSLTAKLSMKEWDSVHDICKKTFRDVIQLNKLSNVRMKSSILWLTATASFLVRDFHLCRKLTLSLRSSISTSNRIASHQIWAAKVCVLTLLSYIEEADPHLRYGCKEMTNWLRTFGPTNAYEQALFRFCTQVGGEAEIKATPPMLTRFRTDLEKVFEDAQLNNYVEVFPILAWIDSKLSGRDLREYDFE